MVFDYVFFIFWKKIMQIMANLHISVHGEKTKNEMTRSLLYFLFLNIYLFYFFCKHIIEKLL